MLGIKEVLLGANTDAPALNEFAKLIADELPAGQVECQDLASTVLYAALQVKHDAGACRATYPQLHSFVVKGGDMQQLSAKITEVINAGADKKYAESYRAISAIYFGR
ncbi:hypothetical protein J5500_03245 [Candidatus Saccharibacteria bacterium]|nr:hypothetical protein [Candidatus Saccharibacteria bacterium]